MHCTSCAMLIDGNLEELEGVKSACTSFTKQEVEIEFDGEALAEENIITTIKETGYKVSA